MVKEKWGNVQSTGWARGALFYGVVIILTGLSLVRCNGKSQPSNNSTSNENAQADLELRLKKTDEIRVQINSIRDALRPLESVLTDVSNALNAKITIDGKPADRFRNVVQRLREILKESTKSIVQYKPDGSWVIDRNVSLPLGREDYRCQTSQIEILGQRIQDHDQLTVTLTDCASPKTMTVVEVSVYADRVDASFYPEVLDRLITPDVRIGQCSLHVRKNDVELHCEPIEIKADAFATMVDPLDFTSNSNGIDAMVKIVVRDRSDKFIADLELETHPGSSTRIDIRTNE